MDFWSHQDSARRRSVRLIILYAALVLAFALLAAWLIELLWTGYAPGLAGAPPHGYAQAPALSWLHIAGIALAIAALIGLMTLFAPSSLSSGGRAVAESMQGTLINPQSSELAERRLLNVVEEMALAGGMPVPPVYILKEEDSINAFAAGLSVNDAVIGVTGGALAYLDRSELQAVVGHEFSHILNGDMRLNMRFAKWIFGLLCLSELGRIVLRGASRSSFKSRKDDNRGAIVLIGLLCLVAGAILAVLGKIFQAAVTREREFLADASSVQFTRDRAMASALKKIGGQGSKIRFTPLVDSYSHFFFCSTGPGLFSTHPSLEQRIRRLDPEWNGLFTPPELVGKDSIGPPSPVPSVQNTVAGPAKVPVSVFSGSFSPLGAAFLAQAPDSPYMDKKAAALLGLRPASAPAALTKLCLAAREPLDACDLMYALLLDDAPEVLERQLAALDDAVRRDSVREYKRTFALVGGEAFLPLVELAVPALKRLSERQYALLRKSLRQCIEADGRQSFREWILYQLISSLVGAQYAREAKSIQIAREQRDEALRTLLAALAWLEPDRVKAEAAFAAGLRGFFQQDRPVPPLPEKPDLTALEQSMDALRQAPLARQEAFMAGALRTTRYDGVLSKEETMYLRLLSLCLGRAFSL